MPGVRHWFMPTEFCWLLELRAVAGHRTMYLHTARGPGVCGFTFDAGEAQRFATRAEAEAECAALNGALGAVPTEHGFVDTRSRFQRVVDFLLGR